MYCKSDFSSCELYYPWLPDCRVGQSCPQDFLGEMFLVPLGSASFFKQLLIYKEMFLGCDWLIRVQLIPNITQNSAKICNTVQKSVTTVQKSVTTVQKSVTTWRPNFHVCLKISSKFQHNLEFFSDNYDHKTNSKVCWNFVHKIFSHGFYKHEFFK